MPEAILLGTAFLLDIRIGDPVYSWHPVRLMGNLISRFEKILFRLTMTGYVGGGMLLVAVGGIFGLWAAGTYQAADGFWGPGAMVLGVFYLYSAIGLRDLADHARPVRAALGAGDLQLARQQVQRIVGRDADRLDARGVARAAVESVAENFVDGFFGVVFWFVCGACLARAVDLPPTPAALASAAVYRAVNTLDAMVGHKTDRYRKFGCFSAKADDMLNFLPARLSVAVLLAAAWLGGYNAKNGFRIALRDRRRHASPNSGHPESAMAGILGIRLGGPVIYPYGRVDKPWMGDGESEAGPGHIQAACRIIYGGALVSMVLAVGILAGVERIGG